MEPEDKKKLDRALALSEENNKILKTLLRNMRWGRLFRVLYWGVIIAASVGVFYYFQPVLDRFISAYGSFEDGVGKVNTLFSR
jgi:hypothetical protein